MKTSTNKSLLARYNCGPVKLSGESEAWTRKAKLNIAASCTFSSDRTIAEYAKEIRNARPCSIK